jgi:hypothetical protein
MVGLVKIVEQYEVPKVPEIEGKTGLRRRL